MTYAPALSITLSNADHSRFMSSVAKGDDCWTWTARRNAKGYGVFCVGGRNRPAHRVIYAHERGRIPDGYVVCHRCDNPPCVRPSHLFAATPKANTADSISKGRFVKVTPRKPQTHCARGHEFTPENTIARSDGRKSCRACKRVSWRDRDRRRRATKGSA